MVSPGRSRTRRPPARALLWGAAAAAGYLAAVLLVPWPHHGRAIYDGLAPMPPYRWVHPPAGRAADNEPPKTTTRTIPLGPGGSQAIETTTDDLQATVTFPEGALPPRPGESSVKVTLTPLDPEQVAPPPRGRRFDSNAYRIEAVYAASDAPARLAHPVDIVLQYAIHATSVLQLEEKDGRREWVRLPAKAFTGTQDVLSHTDRLGIFVASNP